MSSGTVESYLHEASSLLAREEYQEASVVLNKLFEVEKGHPEGLRLLAETMYRLGQHELALALMADSVDPLSGDAATLYRISELLRELNRPEEAADFLLCASEASPADTALRAEAVALLTQLGREEEARALAGSQSES